MRSKHGSLSPVSWTEGQERSANFSITAKFQSRGNFYFPTMFAIVTLTQLGGMYVPVGQCGVSGRAYPSAHAKPVNIYNLHGQSDVEVTTTLAVALCLPRRVLIFKVIVYLEVVKIAQGIRRGRGDNRRRHEAKLTSDRHRVYYHNTINRAWYSIHAGPPSTSGILPTCASAILFMARGGAQCRVFRSYDNSPYKSTPQREAEKGSAEVKGTTRRLSEEDGEQKGEGADEQIMSDGSVEPFHQWWGWRRREWHCGKQWIRCSVERFEIHKAKNDVTPTGCDHRCSCITGQHIGHACETQGGDYYRIVRGALVGKTISSCDEKRTGAQHDPEGLPLSIHTAKDEFDLPPPPHQIGLRDWRSPSCQEECASDICREALKRAPSSSASDIVHPPQHFPKPFLHFRRRNLII
ncbi:hypothetical protein EDD15DRAFT_2194831 [Pisolithus albus]|nr:hypothetical protein EDD15DRAFT_2194831 [Pisolithus albus]